MRVREPAWELLREDWSCCGEIGCVGQCSGSSPALLLAVLTGSSELSVGDRVLVGGCG